MTQPEVSVVIPTRDRRAMLAQTLRSVLGQQGVTHEVIVVDDGSTDDTPALLAGVASAQVRVLRRADGSSPSAARNAGAALARAPWVAFVDDDDLWAPDKLRAQLESARAVGATWSCTGAVSVDEDLRILQAHRLDEAHWREQLPVRNPIPAGGSTVMVRRRVLEAAGGFDESFLVLEDWDLWTRLAPSGPLAYVPRPLVAYRRHGTSISRSADPTGVHRAIRRHHTGSEGGGDAATLEWMARQQVLGGHRAAAARSYLALAAAGDWRRGLAMALLAPLAPVRWARRWERLARAAVPDDWAAEAESWLAPLRGVSGTPHSGEPDREN